MAQRFNKDRSMFLLAPAIGGIALCACISPAPQSVHADGFRNPFQSSVAIAQGNAFKAQADDASAIHYNPAGMTQVPGFQISGGFQFINVNIDYRSPNGATSENIVPAHVGLPPPGAVFLTANLTDLGIHSFGNLVVGVGLESLYGFATKFPKDGPLRTSVIKAQLPLLDIKPTVAYQIAEWVSFGFGIDIFTFASFLAEGQNERQLIGIGQFPGTAAGDQLELNGTGTTAGMNVSFMVSPLRNAHGKPIVNFGFIWRSQAVLRLTGELLANGVKVANASTNVRFPESYEWGFAVWPVRTEVNEWKLELDVDWVRWSSLRENDIKLSTGFVLPSPLQWEDAVAVMLGTEYTWLTIPHHTAWEWAVRGGWYHASSAVPDVNFDPAFTDATVNNVAVGFGFVCKAGGHFLWVIPCGKAEGGGFDQRSMGMDFVYQALFWETRNVTGHSNPAVNGRYDMFTQGVGFNLSSYFQ